MSIMSMLPFTRHQYLGAKSIFVKSLRGKGFLTASVGGVLLGAGMAAAGSVWILYKYCWNLHSQNLYCTNMKVILVCFLRYILWLVHIFLNSVQEWFLLNLDQEQRIQVFSFKILYAYDLNNISYKHFTLDWNHWLMFNCTVKKSRSCINEENCTNNDVRILRCSLSFQATKKYIHK